jgi:hypothetical protein
VGGAPSPDAEALEGFFAACYQASMLREEERPVVFRAVLAHHGYLLSRYAQYAAGDLFPTQQTTQVACVLRSNRGQQEVP